MNDNSELTAGEPHPSAYDAKKWIIEYFRREDASLVLESFASAAISGHNRLAEVGTGTLRRLLNGEPVSDRYILGLAWSLRNMDDMRKNADNNIPKEEDNGL